MELTQAGKDIMPYIDMILQGAEQISNYGKSMSEISGSLKLAIPDSILIYNMQPFMQAFTHEAPNVQLIVNSIQSGEINQSIADGTADLGINCEKDSYPDSIIHKKLGKYKAVLVASPFANNNLLDFITPHLPIKTELDEKSYNSFYIYHKNKWISPQMELAMDLMKEHLGKENL